ncbi:MAG TPA: hypothetical protein DCE71_01690 [Parachlamydiales bacterium]|nr:hypothetical protein [Parachlamydiales bacterium]
MTVHMLNKTESTPSLCDSHCEKSSLKDKTLHLIFSNASKAMRCAEIEKISGLQVQLKDKEVLLCYEGLPDRIHLRVACYLYQKHLFPIHAEQEITEILQDKKAQSTLSRTMAKSPLWQNSWLVEASMRAAIREEDERWQKKVFFARLDLSFFCCLPLAIKYAKSADSFLVRKILSRVSDEEFLCKPHNFNRNIQQYKLAHLAIDREEKSVISRMINAHRETPLFANPLIAIYRARSKELSDDMRSLFLAGYEFIQEM